MEHATPTADDAASASRMTSADAKRLAYRAFMAGATACDRIPAQRYLDADFRRFWEREVGD